MIHNLPWYRRLIDFILSPLDKPLFICLIVIYTMSLFLLYSADDQSFVRLENKMLHTMLGFVLMWMIAKMSPQWLANFALPLYAIGLILLIGVHFFGITVNGSTRWLNIGLGRIQPSEIMKIALPMLLAWYFHKNDTAQREHHWKHDLIAFCLVMVPSGLILKQPDLGTTILIASSGILVIFFAGLSWKIIVGALVGLIISLPLYWQYGMYDYQRKRVLMLLDPSQDSLGAGYHILQSMTAIGSGGLWGKGWLGGTQTHLDFIPEQTTDFIFAVYAEEFGFLGNLLLLILYSVLIGRGLWIASRANSLYGRLLAAALTMTLFFYAFVNMGMVSGILPVVGVPLPLVSYGGTATLSMMVLIGMLMGISSHSKDYQSS